MFRITYQGRASNDTARYETADHEAQSLRIDNGALLLLDGGGKLSGAYAPGHWLSAERMPASGESEA